MRQSIIGEIYYNLSKEELKKLNKFMKVSQWSRSETIVKCHECLANYTQKGKLDLLDKEILFRDIYGLETYSDNKLRFTLNRLLEAIKEHILLDKNESKNIYTEKVWLDYIQEKRLKKNITYVIENSYQPHNSQSKFLYNYFRSSIKWDYTFNYNKSIEAKFNSLIEFTEQTELFADFAFLRQYCLLITFSNVYHSPEVQIAKNRFLEIKEKKTIAKYVEFDVYIALIELLTNNTLDHYHSFKEILMRSFHFWDDEDKVTLISYLLNFTTAQINRGQVNLIDEQYNIYLFCEENNLFNISIFTTNTRINNVIHTYLRKKEFIRAEQFVNNYVNNINPDLIESCLYFNLARIHFEKKEYKDSLRKLLQVDFGRDVFYSLNSKFLLLKTYFELKDSDPFASLCLSFKEYVKKNKVISDVHKTSSLNFIKMIDKIYGTTKAKAKKLEEEILANAQIAEKNWLLEKIHEKQIRN